MGILKGILKTAKELYQADSNNQLGEYVGGKISNLVNQYDGTEEREFEQAKENKLDRIRKKLDSKNFDNDSCQREIDDYLNLYAQTAGEIIMGYYYKHLGWDHVASAISEAKQEENYCQLPENIREEDAEKEAEAHREALKNINNAIELLDEDTAAWICMLYSAKSEQLHWFGEHVEATRLAIQALPFACNEGEKNWAKFLISGKDNSDVWVNHQGGYGLYNTMNPNTKNPIPSVESWCAFFPDKDSSLKDNEEMMKICAEELQENINGVQNTPAFFANRPYHDRQFIFTVRDLDHIGGCYDETDNIKYVFPLDELPVDITFPIGHPQANTLYYAHPLRPMYLPFENAQLLLFYEKVQEICRLFQCLGATQITTRCLKGSKISQDIVTNYNLGIDGEYKVINASGNYEGKRSYSENKENRDEMFLTQTFAPQKAPYCPDDLLWAKDDPELQTFIRQRLEGGLLEFTKKVSSFETSNISQNQLNEVKAAFQSLMANVSANYSASTDSTFNQTMETEWEISVQFKPLEEFSDYLSPQALKAQAEAHKGELLMETDYFFYMEGSGIVLHGTLQADIKVGDEVIVCGKESEFDSKIEGILMFFLMLPEGKKNDQAGLCLSGATALNIQRGTKIYRKRETAPASEHKPQLPTPAVPQSLTPEEEKYKEEILFCLEDNGSISEEDRRYLERKRKKLGITETRALEIEQQTVPSLTDNEKEYLETYKELAANGITDRTRRLLEREREALDITKERATEIEQMSNN